MRLKKDFYRCDALTAAQELLGQVIVRRIDGTEIRVKIVETEAYLGAEDKACHAYKNKRTSRTETMFAAGGTAYIYLIYGMHSLFNVVVNDKNIPEAVLIRAVEPISGLDIIKNKRDIKSDRVKDLTNGPGKLSQALDIDREWDGYNLISGDELYLEAGDRKEHEIVSAKRVNIDYAEEDKDKLWRFYLKDNSFVSQ